jgi:ribonuclease-3
MKKLPLKLEYQFTNNVLLARALMHPSLQSDLSTYERSEFLGDRVLGLVMATYLYTVHPEDEEGNLARRFSNLVKGETLAKVAESLHLGNAIQMSASEEHSGGRRNITILADACEALIGAIYLDGGFEAAEKFILSAWKFLLERGEDSTELDAKTTLQEYLQKKRWGLPAYSVAEVTGPDHAPEFVIRLYIKETENEVFAKGLTKRQAEQEAAAKMLLILQTKGKKNS